MENNTHEQYYYNNQVYNNFLDTQSKDAFVKYVDIITGYLVEKKAKFLDVGCGSGIALDLLSKNKPDNIYIGIEINKSSKRYAEEKGLKIELYNGTDIPFPDESFDVVGSINVLEHVNNVDKFLSEKKRVLKKHGYMIIACPNFLSTTNNFHWHTTGINRKIKNLAAILYKTLSSDCKFEKMKTIDRIDFHPDDDACNVTNPLDIYNWSRTNNLKLKYWSSQLLYSNNRLIQVIDKTFLKVFFGACFFVFEKE